MLLFLEKQIFQSCNEKLWECPGSTVPSWEWVRCNQSSTIGKGTSTKWNLVCWRELFSASPKRLEREAFPLTAIRGSSDSNGYVKRAVAVASTCSPRPCQSPWGWLCGRYIGRSVNIHGAGEWNIESIMKKNYNISFIRTTISITRAQCVPLYLFEQTAHILRKRLYMKSWSWEKSISLKQWLLVYLFVWMSNECKESVGDSLDALQA